MGTVQSDSGNSPRSTKCEASGGVFVIVQM